MPLVEVVGASYSYQGRSALTDVSLEIGEGRFTALLGANGSGKSTLAKLLNAILVPKQGKVIVDGLDSSEKGNVFEIRRRVGLVLQNPDNQIVADTVEDDVAFGPSNLGLSRVEVSARVKESLRLCGIEELSILSPSRLSGGQKQLVSIAGVLALHPRCIVLDEATSMLDPQARSLVLSAVERLRSELGMAIVLITHNPEEASLADAVHILSEGRLLKSGKPADVFSDEVSLEKAGIGIPMAYKFNNELKRNGIDLNLDIVCKDKIVYGLSRGLGC